MVGVELVLLSGSMAGCHLREVYRLSLPTALVWWKKGNAHGWLMFCERASASQRNRLPCSTGCTPDASPARSETAHVHTPIFLSLTVDDNVMDIALGVEMRQTLIELGVHNVV